MSTCNGCDQTIKFVRMEDTHRQLPVQPIPDPDGTVAARYGLARDVAGNRALVGYVVAKDRPLQTGYRLYRAHHGECARHSLEPRRGPLTSTPPPSLFDLDPEPLIP